MDSQNSVSTPRPRKELGFGEGVCTCAGCMRKAPPIREDPSARIAALMVLYAKVRDQGVSGKQPSGTGASLKANDRDKEKAAALMAAVEASNANWVEEQLKDGFQCETLRSDAATELILSAAQIGHVGMINTLQRMGANLEVTDEVRGGRPLMHAATNGHAGAAAALLKHNVEREARDWNGYTALMIAVFSDRSTTAAALLDHGAMVDAIDDKGRTGLCHAARYGSTDCIHVLAEHGADVFAVDEDGLTPLEIAEQHGRLGAASALRKLEHRQRLQDKRLLRQRMDVQGNSLGSASSGTQPARSKEEADLNMAALLRELEEDTSRQEERKAAKKAKKKGKLCKKKESKEDESTANASPGGKKSKACSLADEGGSSVSDATQAVETSEDATLEAGSEDGLEDDLRTQWTKLLDEAVGCQDLTHIQELEQSIRDIMDDVAKAGVSVKYGKKVLTKLGKVAPAQESLQAIMQLPDSSVRPTELQTVLDAANAVRRHVDSALMLDAEARLERLSREYEEAKWSKLKAELGVVNGHVPPVPPTYQFIPESLSLHPSDMAHSEHECIVCLAASKDAVLIPCGHICMCFDCSQQVQASSNTCPICRSTIDHAFQVL